MEQDFTKGLNVCIGNYGYYNEGSLHDAWITETVVKPLDLSMGI